MEYDPHISVMSEFSNEDLNQIVEVWESSVRATHHFLSEDDIKDLRPQVIQGVKNVDHFVVIKDEGIIKAFIGCHE